MTYSIWKRTGLHVAAEYDQVDAVKLLLEAGADPNIRDEYGYTALNWHVASFRDEGENPLLVRALIQAGADVNIRNSTLDTPLHFTDCAACAIDADQRGRRHQRRKRKRAITIETRDS